MKVNCYSFTGVALKNYGNKFSHRAESKAVYLVCTFPGRRDAHMFMPTKIYGFEVRDLELEGKRLENWYQGGLGKKHVGMHT